MMNADSSCKAKNTTPDNTAPGSTSRVVTSRSVSMRNPATNRPTSRTTEIISPPILPAAPRCMSFAEREDREEGPEGDHRRQVGGVVLGELLARGQGHAGRLRPLLHCVGFVQDAHMR